MHCHYCVSGYTGKTDIKLGDCDKHVQTDCKNDHSTSKVLGHVTRQSINLILTSGGVGEGCGMSGKGRYLCKSGHSQHHEVQHIL